MAEHTQKPIVRWTLGDPSWNGFQIFMESVRRAQAALGKDKFEWIVLYNNLSSYFVRKLGSFARSMDLEVVESDWLTLPIPKEALAGPARGRQGSFWKLCPARIDITRHEIVLDNDLIICSKMTEIEQFLEGTQPLLLEENVRCFGKYFSHFPAGLAFSSGLYGLPPNFDFSEKIFATWKKNGSFAGLKFQEEQALVALTLWQSNPILIRKERVTQLLASGGVERVVYEYCVDGGLPCERVKKLKTNRYKFSGRESAIHFCEVNRLDHQAWYDYRCQFKNISWL